METPEDEVGKESIKNSLYRCEAGPESALAHMDGRGLHPPGCARHPAVRPSARVAAKTGSKTVSGPNGHTHQARSRPRRGARSCAQDRPFRAKVDWLRRLQRELALRSHPFRRGCKGRCGTVALRTETDLVRPCYTGTTLGKWSFGAC
eukprot:6180744-Pleurochrysis_carterae.AAC.1